MVTFLLGQQNKPNDAAYCAAALTMRRKLA
jgi:hypothetical protein